MIVISPTSSELTGVFFCKYEDNRLEDINQNLVKHKTVFIQLDTPKKVDDVVKLASGTISLAICTHNPEIAKMLFMEDTNLFIGLIERNSFLYLDEPLDMFISFILLNFSINNIHTIASWKTRFPNIRIYVYNVNTIGDVYQVVAWNVDGILTEHVETVIQTLIGVNIDIGTNLGTSVFSVVSKTSAGVNENQPIINIRNRSRNRYKIK